MDSTNQNSSNFIYKSISCKSNLNLFRFYCALPIDFIRVDWVDANAVLTGNSYPLVSVTDRIPSTNYKSKYHNWRGGIELSSIKQLNLQAVATGIEEWIVRFELWCYIRTDVKTGNQTAFYFTFGGRSLYSLKKNLALARPPASIPFDELRDLLLNHVVPVNFHATKHSRFHFLVHEPSMKFREIILTLQTQGSKSNSEDQLKV